MSDGIPDEGFLVHWLPGVERKRLTGVTAHRFAGCLRVVGRTVLDAASQQQGVEQESTKQCMTSRVPSIKQARSQSAISPQQPKHLSFENSVLKMKIDPEPELSAMSKETKSNKCLQFIVDLLQVNSNNYVL